jgi:putative NADH-flavin reductase
MNIAVFGATGDTGRRFCRRALDNGHQITPFSYRRTVIEGVEEVQSTPIELNDDIAVYHALEGVDAIVSAIGGDQSTRASGIERLVQNAQKKGIVRIISIGGAGILSLPNGEFLKEQSFFPKFLVPISNAHYDAWKILENSSLSWTMICPGTMNDGVSKASYRHQSDSPVSDMKGVFYDDVAHLILKCLEQETYVTKRVSISNP